MGPEDVVLDSAGSGVRAVGNYFCKLVDKGTSDITLARENFAIKSDGLVWSCVCSFAVQFLNEGKNLGCTSLM